MIKTRAFDNRKGKSEDIFGEEFFSDYPSELDIWIEMKRLQLLGYGITFSQVEKIYQLDE